MQGYEAECERLGLADGISKISVQTGTSHGGVVLPDGKIADVKLDIDALRDLSRVARERYGLAGAVQHGASTLPSNAFGNFPRVETAEIHLATNFQNIVFDHPSLPSDLKARMYAWLDANAQSERKDGDSDDQFYYKARKKAIGPFKQALWSLPENVRATIAADLERTFAFLFEQLNVNGTADLVDRFTRCWCEPWMTPTRASRRSYMRRNAPRDIVLVERGDASAKWLFWGALLGAGLALLYAPRNGEETRRGLQRRLWKLRAMTEEKVDELVHRFGPDEEAPLASGEYAFDESMDEFDSSEPVDELPDADEIEPPSARAELERRLADARARRRAVAASGEPEEPLA
jgi:hypothetical protein